MTRKANKTATGWRKRYFVSIWGHVYLVRGKGRKRGYTVMYQMFVRGKWRWMSAYHKRIYETEAQLTTLRLQGNPVDKEPRW